MIVYCKISPFKLQYVMMTSVSLWSYWQGHDLFSSSKHLTMTSLADTYWNRLHYLLFLRQIATSTEISVFCIWVRITWQRSKTHCNHCSCVLKVEGCEFETQYIYPWTRISRVTIRRDCLLPGNEAGLVSIIDEGASALRERGRTRGRGRHRRRRRLGIEDDEKGRCI